ncbi:hypothetical protein JXB31_03295 [Candidatus Woesearchaeota archaeon]|nr:hypothetical protein [Candidatus Woesearchaeota archaeon]
MTAHHLFSSDHLKHRCMYCGNDLVDKDWESDHVMEKHYKVNKCRKCGKNAKIAVGFDGDGNDSWAMPIEKQLEKNSRIMTIVGHQKKNNADEKKVKELERIVK